MIRYLDSSAALAWLLHEAEGDRIEAAIDGTTTVLVSDLTLIECDRILHRLLAQDPRRAVPIEAARSRLHAAAAAWQAMRVTPAVVDRARGAFPDDHVRSLDAIHLASIVELGGAVGDVEVLSLDDRIRRNAVALGFRVAPA